MEVLAQCPTEYIHAYYNIAMHLVAIRFDILAGSKQDLLLRATHIYVIYAHASDPFTIAIKTKVLVWQAAAQKQNTTKFDGIKVGNARLCQA